MKPVILWADDEIELLKPHIMFLTAKGYEMITANSGSDALACVGERHVDLVILDENMPGISGLDALTRIKQTAPHLPVIMITKSEEEDIMDQAIGGKIADYLIKPVNPNQILLAIKKALDAQRLVAERTSTGYREQFGQITSQINDSYSLTDWKDLYRKLVYWQMELDASADIAPLLDSQTDEANAGFGKFVKRHYEEWVKTDASEAPLMSHNLMRRRVTPLVADGKRPWLIVIDNFRLDQWLTLKTLLSGEFTFADEDLCCSILPTATQYARNSIFSGLLPEEIATRYPELWKDEDDEESKNLNEAPLIAGLIERLRQPWKFSYHKINDSEACRKLAERVADYAANDFNVVVINFIDMLSHARTDNSAVRELASTDAGYRSITASWFRHSPALTLFAKIAATGSPIVLTTDHGTIRVDNPVKIVADRFTTSGLRYKVGKNMDYDPRKVYEIKRPREAGLPAPNLSSAYIFALGRDFFVYPTNYNHYVQHFTDTFQHGGISLQEMLVPVVTLIPK